MVNAVGSQRFVRAALGLGTTLALTLAGAALTPAAAADDTGRALKRSGVTRSWMPTVAKIPGKPHKPQATAGISRLLSVAPTSVNPDISGDGRYVAFVSNQFEATPDTSVAGDVFVTDTRTGVTTRVSTDGGLMPSISDNGRYVAYLSGGDIRLADLRTGKTVRVSAGDATSSDPKISADGSTVAFTSYTETMGEGLQYNVLSWNRSTGRTTNLTPGTGTGLEPTVSANGAAVAFWSHDQLVAADTDEAADVYLAKGGALTLVSESSLSMIRPSISSDGSRVAYSGGDPMGEAGYSNVYVWSGPTSRSPAITTAVTTGTKDAGGAVISGDGRQVAYHFNASGNYEVYRYDVAARTSQQLTHGDGPSTHPVIDADGNAVAFPSRAADLVVSDPNAAEIDVFVWRG